MPLSPSDLSTRVKRDRPNHQRACVHRVVCHEGEDVLEKMKIIPICKWQFDMLNVENKAYLDIRMPVVGIQRKGHYKELRLRHGGKHYKVSKTQGTDLSFACLSDSIPSSSVGWIREEAGTRQIISTSQYLELPNAQVDQSGKYYCYGANRIGIKIVELRLRIH